MASWSGKALSRLLTSLLFSLLLPIGSYVQPVSAMSTEQKKIFDMDIKYFNVCSQTTSADPGTASSGVSLSAKEFVQKYAQAAFDIGKAYGIPYEIILAQAALESGWGGSTLSSRYNNFFGIKADSSWTGPSVSMATVEEGSGGQYKTDASFRVYASPTEGFTGYAQFIHDNKRYAEALKHPGDPRGYIEEVKKAGYATDGGYVAKVWSVEQSLEAHLRSETNLPPSSEVEFDASIPSDDGGTEGECVDDSESVNADVVATAFRLAWSDNDHHDQIKPEYAKALGQAGFSTDLSFAQSCDHFIAAVMRSSGADRDFPISRTSVIQPYMENSDKYQEIANLGNTSNLQPGDIFVANGSGYGHIFMYVGEQTGGWQIASASLDERTGNLDKTVLFSASSQGNTITYKIFRFKGAQ